MGRVKKTRQKYCMGLVSEILGNPILEEERTFDFLRGDPTPRYPRGKPLPVDAYFPEIRLVVEFREGQHYSNGSKFSWWNSRRTATGQSRRAQRARYDRRRENVLPKHGMTLLVVRDDELHGPRGVDRDVIRRKLVALGIVEE